MIKDSRIASSSYQNLVKSACETGGYSEMLHIYGVSSVIGEPLRSYFPPVHTSEFLSEPLTRKVVGHRTNESVFPALTLMWTQMVVPASTQSFQPNHFVLLVPTTSSTSNETHVIIDSDDCSSTDGESSDADEETFSEKKMNAEKQVPLHNQQDQISFHL